MPSADRLGGGDEWRAGPLARRAAFVDAMSAAVTGVSVVTTDGPHGRYGRTVSSWASVSADPPLVVVSLRRSSPLSAAVRAHGTFGVSVLGAGQAAVAERFAGRSGGEERFCFGGIAHHAGVTRAPLIEHAAAWLECGVVRTVEAGTHTLFVGAVLEARRGSAAPLAHHARGYARVLR